MGILFIVVEATLQLFSSWTLAYHFSLLVSLPAKLIAIPFIVIFCPLGVLSWRRWMQTLRHTTGDHWFLLGTAGLSLATGIFTTFISRPDYDDL